MIAQRTPEAQALLAAIVESSDDAIISKTLDGIITSWNPGAEHLFGYTESEALGKHISLIIPPERMVEETEIINRIRNRQKVDHMETVRIRKDGEHVDISLTVSPILDAGGQVIGASKTARDISERKRKDAEILRYVHELERSNQELDDFAYIASHDLKEPLRGLHNQARFLQEDYEGILDEEGIRRLKRLGYLAQRMETLINDLLYFSRLGRTELAIQKTDLNEVVTDTLQMMDAFLKERHARIKILGGLPKYTCDKTRVAEVFRNLITNAVKYNNKSQRSVEIGFLGETYTVSGPERDVFFVRDDGVGIDPKFHKEIFRIFRRLKQPQDEKESGTGVGLTFVKKIVERHGGHIWLESSPGNGTTFYFTLKPKEEANERAAA